MSGALDVERWYKAISARLSGGSLKFCMYSQLVDQGSHYEIIFPAKVAARLDQNIATQIRDGMMLSKPIKFKRSIDSFDMPIMIHDEKIREKKIADLDQFRQDGNVDAFMQTFPGSTISIEDNHAGR